MNPPHAALRSSHLLLREERKHELTRVASAGEPAPSPSPALQALPAPRPPGPASSSLASQLPGKRQLNKQPLKSLSALSALAWLPMPSPWRSNTQSCFKTGLRFGCAGLGAQAVSGSAAWSQERGERGRTARAGPLCLCQLLSSDLRHGSAGLHVHACTGNAVSWGHRHLVVCRADTHRHPLKQREGQEIRGLRLGWRAENC